MTSRVKGLSKYPTVYHDSLKRRILRLESLLKIPGEDRHLFNNVTLLKPTLETLKGEKISANEIGKKTIWRGLGGNDVNVEELVREWYVRKGWKGFHSENGILTTIVRFFLTVCKTY